jgi:hypothetical protein
MKNPVKAILIIGVLVAVGFGLFLAVPGLSGWISFGQPTPLPSVTSSADETPTAAPTLSTEATEAPASTPEATVSSAPSTTAAPTADATRAPTRTPTSTPSPAVVVAVGDSFGGGVVAYLLQSGDPGYSATVQHGIIAAISDQSAAVMWAKDAFWSTSVPGTLAGIRKGSGNTDLIIAQQGTGTDYAAGMARAYDGGGFTDWYLPSIEELEKLFENRAAIGGFAEDASYWSSVEGEAGSAWRLYFYGSGTQVKDDKGSNVRVRAVRSF